MGDREIAIRKRLEGIAPSPWKWESRNHKGFEYGPLISLVENDPNWDDHHKILYILGLCSRRNGLPSESHVLSMTPETAELIQNAPEDLKYLLNKIDELEAQLKSHK